MAISDERLREIASAIAADVLGNDHLRHKLDEQQSDEVYGDVQTIVMRHLKALSRRAAEQQEPVGLSKEQTDWVMVPREPTPEMKSEAMDILMHRGDIYQNPDGQIVIETITPADLWRAMLSAAPASPSPAGGVQAVAWSHEEIVQQCSEVWDNTRVPGDRFWHELPTDMQVLAMQCFRRGYAALSSQAQTTGGVE